MHLTKQPTRVIPSFSVEMLEDRQLLSVGNVNWAPFPRLIGQDLETTNYPSIDGTGQNIAIVDHGIDYTHPKIGGGAGIGPSNRVIYGYNFASQSAALSQVMDYDGHGTGVSGIIGEDPILYGNNYDQGIALGSKQLSLKTGDIGDNGAEQHIKDALDWIIGHYAKYHISVVNLTDFVGSGYSEPIFAAELKTLHDLGIFIASPVGNVPQTRIAFPAADPYVFGVGAISDDNRIWDKTQVGSALDILAPGNSVEMTYDDYSQPPGQRQIITPYATGTSFATAHVSALALLIKQVDPSTSPDEIMQIMQDSGVNVTDPVSGGTYQRIAVNSAVSLAYQRRDDIYQNINSRARRALAIPLNKAGNGSVSGLKLLVGETKWQYFNLGVTSAVGVTFQYNKNYGAYPTSVQLLDKYGQFVANIGPGGYTGTLSKGTYYVVASARTQTLVGTYGVAVSARLAGRATRGSVRAAIAPNSITSAHFSTTPIADSVLSGTDASWQPGTKKSTT